MNFKTYQELSKDTDLKHEKSYYYLGLANEVGELLGKVKKFMRGDYGEKEFIEMMKNEMGDVGWYMAMICNINDLDWNDIMEKNLVKLEDRKRRGVIKGDGDNR
jgi:NTP pyrophosphatase (non-canonical NTP hydrolase)